MSVSNNLYSKFELRKLFAENGMYIGDVAEKAGVTRQTIHNIINGRGCRPVVAKRICDAFGVNMWDYFELRK